MRSVWNSPFVRLVLCLCALVAVAAVITAQQNNQNNFGNLTASVNGLTISPGAIGRASTGDSPTCYVDGTAHANIASCISFLNAVSPGINGGTIWTNIPEEFTTQVLKGFTGRIYLNNATQQTGVCTPTTCWMTSIPLLVPSRLTIIGVGVTQKSNMSQGTAFAYDPALFPTALGGFNTPPPGTSVPSLSASAGNGGMAPGPVIVALEPVNNVMGGTTTPRTPMFGRAFVTVVQITQATAPISLTNCTVAGNNYTLATANTNGLANGNYVAFTSINTKCTGLNGSTLQVSNVTLNTSFQVTCVGCGGSTGAITGTATLGSGITFNMPTPLTSTNHSYDEQDLAVFTTLPGICYTTAAVTGCTNTTSTAAESSNKMTFTLGSGTYGKQLGAGSHVVVKNCSVSGYNSSSSITGDWVVRQGGGNSSTFTVYNPVVTGLGAATGCDVYVMGPATWPIENVASTDLACPGATGSASSGDVNACKAQGQGGNQVIVTNVAPYGTDNTRNTMWYGQVDGSNPKFLFQAGVWANTAGEYDVEFRDLTSSDVISSSDDDPAINCPGIDMLISTAEEQSGLRGVGFHGGCVPPAASAIDTAYTVSSGSSAGVIYTLNSAQTGFLTNQMLVKFGTMTGCTDLSNQLLLVSNVTPNTSFQVTGTVGSATCTGTYQLGASTASVGVAVYSASSNSHLIELNMGSSSGSNMGQYYGVIIDGLRKTFAAARWFVDSSINPHCTGCTGTFATIQPAGVAVVGNFQGAVANPQVGIHSLHAEIFSVGAGMGAGAGVLVNYGANVNVDTAGISVSGASSCGLWIAGTGGNVSFQDIWASQGNDVCDDEHGVNYAAGTRAHSGATDMVIGSIGAITATAPLTIVSGFSSSGTTISGVPTSFHLVIGATPTNTGVISMDTAQNKWAITCNDITTPASFVKPVSSGPTQITLNNYQISAGSLTQTNWSQNDEIECQGAPH